jgi:hypothetical protein
MTRPLILTAVSGFVAAVVCFMIVAALGPINFETWSPVDAGLGFNHHGRHHWRNWPSVSGEGPLASRELNWGAGDRLSVDVPADVTYTQGPATRLTVTGPKGMVDHVTVDHGALGFDAAVQGGEGLKIALTAPAVNRFAVDGSGRLTIAGYDQKHIRVSIAGSGDIVAKGRAEDVSVFIAGSGSADLGGLDAQSAHVSVAGSGATTIAPRQSAKVSIAGSGDVTLTTQPPSLDTNIFGSGHILHAAPAAAPTAAPAPVTPAQAPPAAKKI